MSERFWLTRSALSNPPQEHTGSYEKSSYTVFDPIQWRRATKEMVLEYKQLEAKPNSNSVNNTSTPVQPSIAGTPSSAAPMMSMGGMPDDGRK
jgi:hypothetical protein